MITKKIVLGATIIFSSLLLSACGKNQTASPTPTSVPKQAEIKPQDRPYISLIPRSDGHQLKLKINHIPSSVTQIEYELIYSASDQGNEIEKGLGDTLKVTGADMERDLLLGTESCTNGCKYKYDEGITGGTLTLNLISNGLVSTYETPFAFLSSVDIKKSGGLTLPTDDNLNIKATPAISEYFVLLHNYGYPANVSSGTIYTVFASNSGKGKVTTTTPANLIKSDKTTIAGDYILP